MEAFLVLFGEEERRSVVGYQPISRATFHCLRFTAQVTLYAYHDERDWEKYPVPDLGIEIERHPTCRIQVNIANKSRKKEPVRSHG